MTANGFQRQVVAGCGRGRNQIVLAKHRLQAKKVSEYSFKASSVLRLSPSARTELSLYLYNLIMVW